MEEDSNLLKLVKETIERTIKDGLTTNNLETVYKLAKIKHMETEDKNMYGNYGNYSGRGPGHGSYGRGGYGEYGEGYGNYGNYGRGSYGRRGVDARYRGDDSLDRMYGEYGRYQESRERYGANDQETDKSFHYMVKALEDFVMVLKEEAETPQQKQQLMEALQNSMR